MKMWKEAGVKVIPVVASVAMAKRMERCGADAVVAEERAGGHIGEIRRWCSYPGCGCSAYPGHCGRRDRRRKRYCSGIHAGRERCRWEPVLWLTKEAFGP